MPPTLPQITPDQLKLAKEGPVEYRSTYGFKRLIAIGDVHGCVVELAELLKKIDLQPTDFLIFLADSVDRGPASGDVVRFVRDLCENREGTACVLGNHDEKHVRARRHFLSRRDNPAYKMPMRMEGPYLEVHQQLTDEDCLWLAQLPAAIKVEAPFGYRILTHAGVHPTRGIKMPMSGLIRICWVDQTTLNPVPHLRGTGGTANGGPPPNCKHWSELYAGSDRVIYGHAVLSQTDPVVRNNTYGIDTGACYGGHLTAYIEDLGLGVVSFEQVKGENYAAEWTERAYAVE